MGILKNIFKKFSLNSENNTLNGEINNSTSNGCQNIENNIQVTLSNDNIKINNVIPLKTIEVKRPIINNKKTYIKNNIIKKIEYMEETRYFQWLLYEKNKEIVIFDKVEQDEGINYVVFKNGARCNEELIAPLGARDITGKVMAEIESPDNMWVFREDIVGGQEEKWETNADGEKVCVVPFLPGKKKIVPVAPRPPIPKTSKFGNISNASVVQPKPVEVKEETKPVIEEPKKETFDDPVFGLLEKAKKINQDLNITLTIPLPSKGLYDVAKENFEEGDKKVCEFIVEKLDVTYLKECLKEALLSMYENQNNVQE